MPNGAAGLLIWLVILVLVILLVVKVVIPLLAGA